MVMERLSRVTWMEEAGLPVATIVEQAVAFEVLDVASDEFGLGHAGELFVGDVGLEGVAVAVGDEDAVLDAVEDGVEVLGDGVGRGLCFFSQNRLFVGGVCSGFPKWAPRA
jgi:hypothetical protein